MSQFKEVLPKVVQTVRAATSLAAQDVNFNRSVDPEFAKESLETSKKLVILANDLMESIGPDTIDAEEDHSFAGVNWKAVSNTVDTLFEKVETLFDQIQRGNVPQSATKYTYLEESNNARYDDNHKKAEKMKKPQEDFRIKVDNSETGPFKPLLTSKPNALVPYGESVQLVQPERNDETDEIDPPYFPHPYLTEIDRQPYPNSVLEKKEPIPSTPWTETSAIWVDTPSKLQAMIAELREASEIAVDLEHHDYRSYYGLVSLMQISNRTQDWIVDTLALRNDLEPLNEVFTNPEILKVFHGAFMDIIWLQRDLGLYIVSLFDTYHASKKLGFPRFSLAYLLEAFANFKTSKKYQLADWRIRPLASAMMAYARSDTHFLLNIYDQLRNKLIEANSNKLQDVLYQSRQVAKRRFEYTKYRPTSYNSLVTCPVMSSNPKEPYLPIMTAYNVPFHLKPVMAVLYEWRDNLARKLDESVRYVMPNQVLANLTSLTSPVDVKKVLGVSSHLTEFVRNNAGELAELIQNALNQTEANDWDLVDKIHKQEDEAPKIVTTSSVKSQNQYYEELCQKNLELLSKNSSDIISKASIVFASTEPQVFAVSYGNQVKASNLQDAQKRLTAAYKEFNKPKTQPIQVESIVVEDTPTQAEAKQETKPIEVTESEPQESKDDIITLRKYKKQATRKPKHQEQNDPAYNFANADKIMVEDSKTTKKRKKAFDPYGNSGTGPRGAKRSKPERGGKSMTFRRK